MREASDEIEIVIETEMKTKREQQRIKKLIVILKQRQVWLRGEYLDIDVRIRMLEHRLKNEKLSEMRKS